MRIHHLPILFILALAWLPLWIQAQSTVSLCVDDLQLVGAIADTQKIELLLQGDGKHSFFDFAGDSCREFKGDLYDRKELTRKSVVGRICRADRSFVLKHFAGDVEMERFVGKWDPEAGEVSGLWAGKGSSKRLPFQLTLVKKGTSNSFSTWLYQLALLQLSDPPGSRNGTRDLLLEFKPEKKGDVVRTNEGMEGAFLFLSPTRVEVERIWSVNGSKTRGYDLFQLLPRGEFALHYSSASFSPSQTDPGKGTAGCTAFIKIFQIQHLQWEDVTDTHGSRLNDLAHDPHGPENCSAVVLHDRIRIGSQKVNTQAGGSGK